MKNNRIKRLALVLMGEVVMSFLSGCFSPKYTVSSDDSFLTGLGEYQVGAKVDVVLELLATDTDYYFFVDGEPFNASFDYKRGYIISFTMPNHDVYVSYEAVSSMYGS